MSTPYQRVPNHNSNQAGGQFLTALTAYFVGYIVFEVPCNIILKLTSPRFWLPTITLVWGITCTLTGLTQNFGGFLTARMFVGMAESGYFPGIAFYLSMWYKRNEQLYRLALIIATVSLGSAFGGLLVSYAQLYPLQIAHNASGVRHCQNEGDRRPEWMEVDLHNRDYFCSGSRHCS